MIQQAITYNLSKAKELTDALDGTIYCDKSVGPYFSSIGSHLRHLLDFYDCVLDGKDQGKIDLTSRKRNEDISNKCEVAGSQIRSIQEQINKISEGELNNTIAVTDDCGMGKITIDYTLEAILAQANSHAIHHYATIAYILFQLDIDHAIEGFGYNPTTPTEKRVGI